VTAASVPPPAIAHPGWPERLAMVIGIIFYTAGSAAFIGIAIAFFMLRLYKVNNDSRIAFIVLFAGLFFSLQGLIFILVARGGELRRHAHNPAGDGPSATFPAGD
jgi:hypothetical protein